MDVKDEELQELYEWVDEIPLSRPKRNIARDFSDGVLVAEVVKNYHPRLVELHNYSSANGLALKLYNWSTLNQKVFRKLGFVVRRADCEAVANAAPGAVERVLKLLKTRLAEFEDGSLPLDRPRSAPGSQIEASAADAASAGGDGGDAEQPALPWGEQAALLRIEQQEGSIADLTAANEALEAKVQKLQAVLVERDDRIADLEERLQSLAAGANRNCNIIRPARPLAERTPNSLNPPRKGNAMLDRQDGCDAAAFALVPKTEQPAGAAWEPIDPEQTET